MPRTKNFMKREKKHVPQAPTTADEYLAAGVDFEEAGEKWRGGDAVKSTRFFIRAIECYDEALKKFPDSFDLAYNKARVQYELTQHPRLLAQLPGTLLDLLKTALDSSRYALSLNQDNADVLFNTAQILTSIVEALDSSHSSSSSSNEAIGPLPLLEEALTLFQRCLTLQEYQHTESLAQAEAISASADAEPDTEDGGVSLSSQPSDTSPPQDDRWASIIEPVTNTTLLDNLLAQLETLTTLSSLVPASNTNLLSWIEEYSSSLLSQKLPIYIIDTEREQEAALTRANFLSALADAKFRSVRMDIQTYAHVLEEAFRGLELGGNAEGLCDCAEALLAFNSSVRVNGGGSADLDARWKALTSALENLTAATKIPDVENVANIHMLRGDVELLRWQLGRDDGNAGYEVARKNAGTLVRNAEKFYRGAKVSAQMREGMGIVGREAGIKEVLAADLGKEEGLGVGLKELVKGEGGAAAREVLEDAVDEGLVTVQQVRGMGIV